MPIRNDDASERPYRAATSPSSLTMTHFRKEGTSAVHISCLPCSPDPCHCGGYPAAHRKEIPRVALLLFGTPFLEPLRPTLVSRPSRRELEASNIFIRSDRERHVTYKRQFTRLPRTLPRRGHTHQSAGRRLLVVEACGCAVIQRNLWVLVPGFATPDDAEPAGLCKIPYTSSSACSTLNWDSLNHRRRELRVG